MTSVNSPSSDCHLFVRNETLSFLLNLGQHSRYTFSTRQNIVP
jgi:hypothetical protein